MAETLSLSLSLSDFVLVVFGSATEQKHPFPTISPRVLKCSPAADTGLGPHGPAVPVGAAVGCN